jgi:phospho-N-acetylmuramoyl-pentapeptide-transferase
MNNLSFLALHATVNDAVKIFFPAIAAFIVGMSITPLVTHYLYKWKLWKKTSVALTLDGREATISSKLHNDEARKTPRMGGIIVWASVLITTLLAAFAAEILPFHPVVKLSFLSRNQTWLPLFTLITASLVGLVDDALVVAGRGTFVGGGLSLKKRLLVVLCIGIIGALWFYFKLGVSGIHIPFDGTLALGALFIPFFILTMLAVYSGGIIDGVDGLAGGVFIVMFSAYAVIAYSQSQVDLAAFLMVVVGSLLVFLWFNIPPARFFLSETGTMGLTTTLTVVAFLTGQVLILPIIALPLLLTTGSVIIQLVSKKYRGGKKVFLVAPLHNHFLAKGWPAAKVTMRYWIFSALCGVLGIVLALIS